MYKYFTILRPVSIGTFPKEGLVDFENYDNRRYVPEIDHNAWGYLLYNRELSTKEMHAFDFMSMP